LPTHVAARRHTFDAGAHPRAGEVPHSRAVQAMAALAGEVGIAMALSIYTKAIARAIES